MEATSAAASSLWPVTAPMSVMASYTPAMLWASLTITRMPAFSSCSICSTVCAMVAMMTTCGSSARICSMFVS